MGGVSLNMQSRIAEWRETNGERGREGERGERKLAAYLKTENSKEKFRSADSVISLEIEKSRHRNILVA